MSFYCFVLYGQCKGCCDGQIMNTHNDLLWEYGKFTFISLFANWSLWSRVVSGGLGWSRVVSGGLGWSLLDPSCPPWSLGWSPAVSCGRESDVRFIIVC